ncbi:recombinase family protein [uncultured Tateyamaria sp.]|uniref:recombinase family protein n=1 Tax=uncultured Tateyamaria sp. TaxID=455651 RepID=UPI0026049FCD|nr:recombinase family protein [uncultured Tateyamaria sp.]
MKQCFGYVRVSTKKQEEGVSLDAQRDAILAFAEQRNLTVTKWFEEKQTAAKLGRAVFNGMMKDLRRGAADGVIFHKIDRSVRNLSDWDAVSQLPNLGIDVHIVTESIDFNSRGGRLTADILAVIAADFIRNHQAEVKKGQLGRLKQGLYPFRAPIGYLDNNTRRTTPKQRDLPKRICPIKGPLVREMFELYATGEHSMRSLMPEMEKRGLRNHAGKPLSKHGIETILRNPFYTGLIVMQRSGDVHQGIHEPLVTPSMFKQVQEIKAGKAGKKVTRHNHLYRGLFRCALCGGPMSLERQKAHIYYRCQQSDCPTTTVREDNLEQEVRSHLRALQLSEEDQAKLMQEWEAWLAKDERLAKQRSVALQVDQIKARLERLTDLLIDGTLGKDEFNTRKQRFALEMREKQAELQKATIEHLNAHEMQKFLELMKNLAGLYACAKPAEKRWMVQEWFSNRTVDGRTPCLKPQNWLQSRDLGQLAPHVKQHDPLFEPLSRISK